MRESTRLLLNSVINVTGGVVNTVIALVVIRVIIAHVGREVYGIYEMVASIVTYMPYLQLGMASALVRFTAKHLARQEYEEMNAVVNTALAYFRVAGVLFAGFAYIVAFTCVEWIVDDPTYYRPARIAVIVLGTLEGAVFFWGPLGGVLRATERFGLVNITRTACRVLRVVLLLALLPFVGRALALVCITAIMTSTNLLPILIQRSLALRVTPELKVTWRKARLQLVKPMVSFGVGTALWNGAKTFLGLVPIYIVGAMISDKEVASFSLPNRMFLLVHMLVLDVMVIMMPAATRMAATQRRSDLRQLFFRSSKYGSAISIAGCAGLALLAKFILYAWVGDSLGSKAVLFRVATIMAILAIGRAVVYAQTNTFYILVGMARQRIPSVIAISCVILMGVAMWLYVRHVGPDVFALAVICTVAHVVGWGVLTPIYACRQVGQPVAQYLWAALVRPLVAAVPVAGFWFGLQHYMPLEYRWTTLVLAFVGGAPLAIGGWWFLLFDEWDRRQFGDRFRQALAKVRSPRSKT